MPTTELKRGSIENFLLKHPQQFGTLAAQVHVDLNAHDHIRNGILFLSATFHFNPIQMNEILTNQQKKTEVTWNEILRSVCSTSFFFYRLPNI